MLQKFSHPPLLTPSQQLILPECSPHKICVHPSILSLLLLRVFHPLSPKTGGVVVTFHFSPYVFLLPQKVLQGKEEWKTSSFSSIQPAEKNRGQESSSLIPFKNLRNMRCKYMERALELFVLLVSLHLWKTHLFLDRKISSTEFRCLI